jgi:hypothetical protein
MASRTQYPNTCRYMQRLPGGAIVDHDDPS